MQFNLLNLPVELHLKIIEDLVQDEDIRAHANNYEYDIHGNYQEKQDDPIKIYHDLISWSCTSSYFRNLLAPDIFKTIKLVNNEKSGNSLKTVAKSLHKVHVKELHFIGSALGPAYSEETAFSNTEGILPRCVDALLCNLQWFPSLERLSIEFDIKYKSIFDGHLYKCYTIGETSEQVLKAETSVAWRALMSRTYSALTQNKSPQLKHLEIRQLIWTKVSTFDIAVFHDFLGHLEHFTVSIHLENIRGRSRKIEPYSELMGKLDTYFFNHLAKVNTLSIKAPTERPLGLAGGLHVPLTLQADQMPLLTTLHLVHIFASPELIEFLVSHKDTLKEVTLRNCIASKGVNSSADNGISWSQLFTSIFSVYPAQLRCFELVDTSSIDENQFYELQDEDLRVIRKLSIIQQSPGRKFFPYMIMEREYADFEPFRSVAWDMDRTWAAFLEGEDQESWNQLMRLVNKNAKEATKSESKGADLQDQSRFGDINVGKCG